VNKLITSLSLFFFLYQVFTVNVANGNQYEGLFVGSVAATSNLNGTEDTLKIENSFILNADGELLDNIGYSSSLMTITGLGEAVGTSAASIIDHAMNVKIFPNPTNSMIKIETNNSEEGALSLFDVNGSRLNLMEVNSLEFNELSVEGMRTGVYFLKVYNKKKELVTVEKIIVTH